MKAIRNKKYIFLYIFISFLIFSGCSKAEEIQSSFNRNPIYSAKDLLIHYIDVGQGDAILIQINNKNLLIDSGPESSSALLVKYLKSQGVKQLDIVLTTHPHEDHIGGMDNIIDNFKIVSFYAPKKIYSSHSFDATVSSLKKKKLKINIAKSEISLNLGKGINADILAPLSADYEEINNYSAILKLTYGATKFLFMGDAEKLVENELVASKQDLSADVIKIGHHGSNSSSSLSFLERVSPAYAVISSGKDNDYGHPHKETLNTLNSNKIITYRTDSNGHILLKSDGKSIVKLK